ncbi:MAG: zf-HC2 domain-containing protein [Bacteroidota bacterium]
MVFTHDDVQQRLIDFLYGELDGDARAAFDAHVAACESCRAEVTAFEQTRAAARRVVRAPLDEPVPTAVHARVVEAVARAVAGGGEGARATAARVAPGEMERRRAGDVPAGSRWWDWLRARWTIPMFATVAAMGALLLVRETIFREVRRPLGDTTAGDAVVGTPPVAPGGKDIPGDEGTSVGESAGDRGRGSAQGAPPSVQAEPKTEATTSRPRRAPNVPRSSFKAKADSQAKDRIALGGLKKKSADKPSDGAALEAARSPAKRALSDDLARLREATPAAERSRWVEQPMAELEKRAPAVDQEADEERGRFAQPPPPVAPRAAQAPAAAAPRAAATSLPRRSGDLVDEAPAAPSAADLDERKGSANAGRPSGSSSGAASAGGGVDEPAALAARAERFMGAGNWSQAVAAYRDLLRRFPRHVSVSAWRKRLASAEAAAAATTKAPGKSQLGAPPPSR